MMLKVLFIVGLSIFAFTKVNAEDDKPVPRTQGTVADRTKLVETLFKDYNKKVNPDKITLQFGAALINLRVNEEKNILDSYVWLRYDWVDERLKWDPKEYNNIEVLRFTSDDVWKPDVTLYNSVGVDPVNMVNCWHSNVLIYSSGKILWVPPCKLRSQCSYTFKKEPYGEQTCSLKFGSWTFDANAMDMTFYNNETTIDISDINNTSGFELVSTAGQRNIRYYSCCKEPYVDLSYNVTIKRIPGEELIKRHAE